MTPTDQQFQAAFRKLGHTQFKYGQMDCVRFVALVLEEVTGRDFMAGFSYQSKTQAHSIIKKHGGFIGLIESVLGPPIDSPQQCSPVVCWDKSNGWFMGIHVNKLVVCKNRFGLNQVAASTIKRSFRCPV